MEQLILLEEIAQQLSYDSHASLTNTKDEVIGMPQSNNQ